MSQDFVLFRAPPGGNLATLISGAMNQTIGTVVEVQTAIGSIYRNITWEQMTEPTIESSQVAVWAGCQDGASKIQLITEADGQVRVIHVSKTNRGEVESIIRILGVVAFDEKSLEILGVHPRLQFAVG